MSTKIWTAWRCPSSRLNDLLDTVRPQMFDAAIKGFERLMSKVSEDAVRKDLQEHGGSYPSGEIAGRVARCERVMSLLKQLQEKGSSHLSVDCGLNVWVYQRRCYVIPWGAPSFYEHLTLPAWVEDFAYWDNTDPPADMDWRAWNRRGRTWDKAALDDWDAHRLVYYVLDTRQDGTGFSRILHHVMEPPASSSGAEDAAGGVG